jgi:hypothetical protein
MFFEKKQCLEKIKNRPDAKLHRTGYCERDGNYGFNDSSWLDRYSG